MAANRISHKAAFISSIADLFLIPYHTGYGAFPNLERRIFSENTQ